MSDLDQCILVHRWIHGGVFIYCFFVCFVLKKQYFFVCVWKQVEEALEGVKNATNEQDLANRFKEFGKEMVKLNYVAARRQQVTGSQWIKHSWLLLHLEPRSSHKRKAPKRVCTLASNVFAICNLCNFSNISSLLGFNWGKHLEMKSLIMLMSVPLTHRCS